MSRGPGRLQRAILDTLTEDDWSTTELVCFAIVDEWPMDNPDQWTKSTAYRQVHRALDRLAAVGLVDKSRVSWGPGGPEVCGWRRRPSGTEGHT